MLIALWFALVAANPVEARCRVGLQQASDQLKLAGREVRQRNYAAAGARLDDALRMFGDDYVPAQAIDDTGMHLALAELQRRNGKSRLAAELKRRVLVERLRLCSESSGR